MRQARARERLGQSATVRAACGLCLMLVTLMLVACGGQSGPSGSGSPVAASVAPAAQLTHPVRVDGGRISGLGEGTLRVFRGIPYAAPPVGDLRW
ncbi:MAG TPA: hypothetical protein VIL51_09285, partial [Thermoleophilia bacterium]